MFQNSENPLKHWILIKNKRGHLISVYCHAFNEDTKEYFGFMTRALLHRDDSRWLIEYGNKAIQIDLPIYFMENDIARVSDTVAPDELSSRVEQRYDEMNRKPSSPSKPIFWQGGGCSSK